MQHPILILESCCEFTDFIEHDSYYVDKTLLVRDIVARGPGISLYTTVLSRAPESERFGFTPDEVEALLRAAGLAPCLDAVREWYDGYLFGDREIYNPFSVTRFAAATMAAGEPQPGPYWTNSSGNDIIWRLLELGDRGGARARLQTLLDGGAVELPVSENVEAIAKPPSNRQNAASEGEERRRSVVTTLRPSDEAIAPRREGGWNESFAIASTVYHDLDNDPDALWSTMLFTGYLKPAAPVHRDASSAPILLPNHEVREMLRKIVEGWTRGRFRAMAPELGAALLGGDAEAAESLLTRRLQETISCRDVGTEGFHHAFLAGLLAASAEWYDTRSNREAGDGYPDVMVAARDYSSCAVLEVKCAKAPADLPAALAAAESQARARRYGDVRGEYGRVHVYAVAFHRKRCRVRQLDLPPQ